MEKNEIRLEDPVSAGGITLIPVVRVSRYEAEGNEGMSGMFSKEPAALIMLNAEACKIFNEEWTEISMEDFGRAFPGISKRFSNNLILEQTDI